MLKQARKILTGEKKIAVFKTPTGEDAALHMDISAAYDTIARLSRAETEWGMHIALAHDTSWMDKEGSTVLMSLLSTDMKGEWLLRVQSGEEP